MSRSDPEQGDVTPHRPRRVDGDLAVVCTTDEAVYGPGGDRTPIYCPYCGGNARGDGHEVNAERRTVECSFASTDVVQSCPGCGQSLSE